MLKFKGFLWLDFRGDPSKPGVFQSASVQFLQRHRVRACDTIGMVQAVEPSLLCFVFDTPQPLALTALRHIQLQLPDLPVVPVTQTRSQSPPLWDLRSDLSDYRVQPLSAARQNARLDGLISACLERSDSNTHPYPASSAPLQHGLPWHAPHPPTPRHKTLAALEFVAVHFAEAVRLALVADLCHMCTSEFSRVFKKENGRTFSDYLLSYRISKACELLSGLSVQVKTVAFSVGFNDLSYFARIFRRYTGTTPSLYQCLATGKSPAACSARRG